MTAPNLPPGVDAIEFAERHRWFSWLGLVTGAALILAGVALGAYGFDAWRDFDSTPVECIAAACPDEVWVEVRDLELQCRSPVRFEGPYAYVLASPDASLIAVMDAEEGCVDTESRGVIHLSRQGERLFWPGHGPGNSSGLVVAGAAFTLLGLFCVAFYRARLWRRGRHALPQ